MTRTQVSFDEATYRRAQEEAHRQGVSFAEFCRRAVGRALAESAEDKPWMRFAGALESGDPDASASVDAVVYGRERP